MEIIVTKKAETLVVNIEGSNKIYILNQEQIQNELTWCNTNDHKKFVLDLTGIRFIDTAGFRLLLELNNKYKDTGKELLLSNMTKDAEELFDLLKIKSLFKRYRPKEKLAHAAA